MHAVYAHEDVPSTNGSITPDFKRQIVPEAAPMRLGFDVNEMSIMPYAPDFGQSPQSEQVDRQSVDALVNRIGDIASTTGVEVDRIIIQGRSSDEAGNGIDAGLGEQNQQNLDLAATRANAFGRTFRVALHANSDTRAIRVETAPPQEQILADSEVDRLRSESQADGLSLSQAVHRFNHGGRLASTLTEDLQVTLGDNRGVHVYVEGSKMAPTPFAIMNERQPEPSPEPAPNQKPSPELPIVPVVVPVATRRKYPYGDILPDVRPLGHKNISPVGPGGEPFMGKETADLQAKFDLV